ncbi:MAG: alpha/beta hydrolase [Chitinophagaceae bacterium]
MGKELIYEGRRIYYRVQGSGPAVMLVHGFGETGDVWEQQAGLLAADMQLIVPDLPGSGRSEGIADMSMEGMARVLKALADKEGLAPFIMIGHSMGGYITLAFAEQYPALLQAFGLFHSSAFADSDEKKATRQKGIAFIREHGAFAFLQTAAPNLFSPGYKTNHKEIVDGFIEGLSNFSAESLVSYYEAMMKRPDRTMILKHTSVPVLFILGQHDTAIPLADGLKQCHLPGISYIHILAESGHMGMLEEPGRSHEALVEFCTRAGHPGADQ